MYYAKIIFKTVVWAIILVSIVILISWLMMLCVANAFPQLSMNFWLKTISLLVTVILIAKFHNVFLRYPFNKTFIAQRIINAPIEVVWEQVRPRGRNKVYSILISSIRQVGDNVFRYYETDSTHSEKTFSDVRLIHETPYQVLELEYVDEGSPHDMVRTSCGFMYTFRPISECQTEITVIEIHHKPSLFTFYVFEFLGAHRDDLRQLACVCEGRENISWASAEIAKDKMASCPDATSGDILRSVEEVALIGMTGVITSLIMVTFWIIY